MSVIRIYLFLHTEPTVGPRCVARKQCPMATAEAHASTRTFLRKKQDKPVQCKSEIVPALCPVVTTYFFISFGDTHPIVMGPGMSIVSRGIIFSISNPWLCPVTT